MDAKAKFTELRADMYRELGTTVTTKAFDRGFWKTLDTILKIFSFGHLKDFMKRATTLGRWIAFGEDTDLYDTGAQELLTLVHERRHVLQYDRLGFLFMLAYLFLPLPIGLAYFRYKYEVEAFMDEYKVAQEHGWKLDSEYFIKSLSGASYLWAMPEKWIRGDLMKRGLLS